MHALRFKIDWILTKSFTIVLATFFGNQWNSLPNPKGILQKSIKVLTKFFRNLSKPRQILRKAALFEAMLKGKTFTFFDADDFELIIEYYFNVNFKAKAVKALELGLEQYPNDLSLLLIKVDLLNGHQKFNKSLEILSKLNKFYPGNIDVLFSLGKLYSITESFKENLNLVNAIPSDISTKKIVA